MLLRRLIGGRALQEAGEPLSSTYSGRRLSPNSYNKEIMLDNTPVLGYVGVMMATVA